MNLRLWNVLMSVGVLVLPLAETLVTLAQTSVEGTSQAPNHTFNKPHSPLTQVLFKPLGTGNPPPTRGAGSRNDRLCPQDAPVNASNSPTQPLSLTALVPPAQSGLAWSERPTVWVYLPETSARQMVLSIKAEGAQQHSQRFLPITGEAGIVGVQFDQNAAPLEVGKSYQWAVVLICGDRPSPNDPFVTAWIQYGVPSQSPQNQQSAVERAVWYGEQGAWYDALTTLAKARRSQPTDPTLAKIWADFLVQPSVGLEAIANEPVR